MTDEERFKKYESWIHGIKDPYYDRCLKELLIDSYKRKQSGYDITKGKYLDDYDPLDLFIMISDKKHTIIEQLKIEIIEKCLNTSYNYDEPKPKGAYIATKPDGSIVDTGYYY